MNKKTLGLVAIVVVIIGLAGGVVITHKAKAAPQCLADNKAARGPSGQELTYLQYAAMEANMKAPAGSNADVRITTYNGGQATGSVKFAPGYGTYNFTVTKDNAAQSKSNNLTWKLVSSEACTE